MAFAGHCLISVRIAHALLFHIHLLDVHIRIPFVYFLFIRGFFYCVSLSSLPPTTTKKTYSCEILEICETQLANKYDVL